MAETSAKPRASGTSAAQTIASSGDRARAFSSARRHSILVRILKLALPVGAVLSLAGYGGYLALDSALTKQGVTVGPTQISTTHLTMQTPRYSGVSKDGARYEIQAREAVTDLKMSGPVRLNGITATITQTGGVITTMTATWGTYDTKSETLELYEKIDVEGSTGLRVRMTRATIFHKEGRIVTDEKVAAENETGTIVANAMVFLQRTRKADFRGDVRVRLKPNPAAQANREANKDPAKETPKPAVLPGLAANSGQPIDVQADELDVDDVAKTALFRKNVIARQADATLEAAELDIIYDGNVSIGRARPAPEEGQKPAAQSRLKTIRARGDVVMINKDDRATCETLDYDAATERAILAGNVVLNSGADRKVTAKKVELEQKTDTALLTGDVVVTQARNVLRGQRLAIDRRKGTTRLDTPADAGRASGRIYTLLYQTDSKGGTKGTSKPATAAPASPFGANFRADPSAPIEIEADSLDVFDASKTAVFKVNVVAKQGEFIIRTVEMTAHYTGQALAPGTAPAAKTQPGQGTQLTRVEARGKVFVTGRDGEQVTGDWANFDVKANTVLIGGNVTFNQGRNVGTHSRLLINLTTGEIRFPDSTANVEGPADAPKTALPIPKGPAISAAETGTKPACPPGVVCKSGRAAIVLYPEELKAKMKERKAEDAAKPVGQPVPKAKPPRAKTAEPAPWTTETEPRQ